ncbi:MAG: ATP-binding protein [Spirochaetales bacterium]|nr:ATP-binding protein [Spirochaetales bacterium]
MKWFYRTISETILNQVNSRPVLLLTGIRQSGKSALLQKLFPDARYITFDHYQNSETALNNPSAFLNSFTEERIILDEVQYVPELFRELKIIIDKDRVIPARWILTGSQKFVLLESARESLAGRISLLELNTMGTNELRDYFKPDNIQEILWKGGFPETWAIPGINIQLYLDDYITTYLEKDLRSIIQTPNLRDFHRFLRACAVRTGALVNFTEMARDTGISPNTAKSWLNTLVRSGIITLLEPWFRNISKRLTKTPKLYFNDQGLLCRLLNIENIDQLSANHHSGAVWENFVFNELIRIYGISSERNLFFYRDHNQVEVDFLIEKTEEVILIEAKFAERPGRTNIKKAAASIGTADFKGICTCRVPEKGVFQTETSVMINPLLEPLSGIISL